MSISVDKTYLHQLRTLREKVNTALYAYITQKSKSYQYGGKTQDDAFVRLAEFIRGGKCIRGTLAMYTARELGFDDEVVLTNMAMGLELAHAALLIHDDVMDNDLLRRGRASMYALYIPHAIHKPSADSVETAKSIAISIGDMAFFMAFELFHVSLSNHRLSGKIMQVLMREYVHTGLGQIDDIFFSSSEKDPSLHEIVNIYLYKTARYTFSMPLVIGAMLGNGTATLIERLEKIGEDMGIAFQMRDDEIRILADVKDTGKHPDTDVRENTKTMIRHYLFALSTPAQKKRLKLIFGNKNITGSDMELVRSLVLSTGWFARVESIKGEHVTRAQAVIDMLSRQRNLSKSLSELLHFVSTRDA